MNERERALLAGYLPMSEPAYLILWALQSPRHGYGVMQTVAEATKGRVTLSAGTLYTVLGKLERDKLIEFVGEQERRRVYRLLADGELVLTAEVARLRELACLGEASSVPALAQSVSA